MLKSADTRLYRRMSMGVPTIPREINHEDSGYAAREGHGTAIDPSDALRLQNPVVYRNRRPTIVTHKQLPSHIRVDNDFTNFHTFQIAYESNLLQNDMSYMANQRFLDLYNEVGIYNIVTYFPYLQITLPQLKVDRISQYGALQQAIGEGHARIIIELFYDSQDGFLAYRALLDKMVNDLTIRDIRRTHYQQILKRVYSAQYPDDIRAFCNDYVAAYQGLEKLQMSASEEEKIANLTLHAWTPRTRNSYLTYACLITNYKKLLSKYMQTLWRSSIIMQPLQNVELIHLLLILWVHFSTELISHIILLLVLYHSEFLFLTPSKQFQ